MAETIDLMKSFNVAKNFITNKKVQNTIIIALLLLILVFGAWVRVQNLPGLKDGTTEQYIPLALDPFYFLRVAETIVDQGELPQYDEFRDPMITDTVWHPEILPQTIVLIYKVIKPFNSNISIQFVDVISPVIFFVLGLLVFFFLIYFLTRSKLLALISSALLTVIPPYLYRTLAGFSDHEAMGMFAFFLALLGFTISMNYLSKKENKNLTISGILGLISGFLITFTLASWGGVAKFLFMIVPFSFFVIWIINLRKDKNLKKYILYYVSLVIGLFLGAWILNFPLDNLVRGNLLSAVGIFTLFVLGYIIVDYLIKKNSLVFVKIFVLFGLGYIITHFFSKLFVDKFKIFLNKLSLKFRKHHIALSTITVLVLGIILYQIFVGNVQEIIKMILERIIYPFGTERVGLTVAENKQPYLTEWISQIGKFVFWVFVLGCFLVGIKISQGLKRKKFRYLFSFGWILLISGILFTRISASSILNGTNFFSKAVFLICFLVFIIITVYSYVKSDWKIPIRYIIIAAWMIPMLIAVRGAIRLFFAIVPFVSFIAIWGIFDIYKYSRKTKEEITKMLIYLLVIVAIIGMIITIVNFTKANVQQSKYYTPSASADWQNSMKWVRENTGEKDVFLHWWDYGYWVQTLGERPTFSDGGHVATSFGDHLVGRYVLTTPYPETAKSFMKSNNISYLLIDPTDIGKYTAYSTIGSDEKGNDRRSWLSTMLSDPSQTKETRDGLIRFYNGGIPLDLDVFYNENGTEIFLPEGKAYLGGILLEVVNSEIQQPQGIFVYNGKQFTLPIRYLYHNGNIIDFEQGINSLVYKYLAVYDSSQGQKMDPDGAVMYLSEKTKDSLVAQIYLMNDPENKYSELTLAHSQGNYEFNFFYNGFRGPIRIWEIGDLDRYIEREEFLNRYGGFAELDNLTFIK